MDAQKSYECFFEKATGNRPYDYQVRLAVAEELPELVEIPTGLGKTAAVVLAWLWRRRFAPAAIRDATPRRLVYCLPMRVLVEQTLENSVRWLDRLGLLAGNAPSDSLCGGRLKNDQPTRDTHDRGTGRPEEAGSRSPIAVHVLMGGEAAADWDCFPEQDAILIGTQDVLLSRALNRGYAMSRSHWPVQFGLLNNDCLWVFDEIQLMGSGLATTAQLEAFRQRLWPPACACQSVWMSATLDRSWLRTVDFDPDRLRILKLQGQDLQVDEARRRFNAKKPITKAEHAVGDHAGLADEISRAHRPGTRTLIVVNTVRRARDLYSALQKSLKKAKPRPDLILIHSRFRPPDRQRVVDQLLRDPGPQGTIVVSTQVVEAGVDVSAVTLFTELAPWASLVQRFGRCNRAGADCDAGVFWIDIPGGNRGKDAAMPYALEDLDVARAHLRECRQVGPADLPHVKLPYQHRHVVRSKDLLDLFDTTPDLAGHDIDIDRYVRDVEASDVHVYWRDWEKNEPPEEKAPQRQELCPVPVEEFRAFLRTKNEGRPPLAYRWDFLEKVWVRAGAEAVYSGQVYLLHVSAGGYSADTGWDAKANTAVAPVALPGPPPAPEANEDDPDSEVGHWQSIAQHSDVVCQELDRILDGLEIAPRDAESLRWAARWHDRGKAHPAFVAKLKPEALESFEAQRIRAESGGQVAKAPRSCWRPILPPNATWDPNDGRRRHFRHELASALALLMMPEEAGAAEIRDLAAYLVAAHHGKVRLSIRSLPNEFSPPGPFQRFARGVWDGDTLPVTELGDGVIAPEARLSLEPMELGLCESPPFTHQPSWAERMLRLRDTLGPFRLAFLEALLRSADWRASRAHQTLKHST